MLALLLPLSSFILLAIIFVGFQENKHDSQPVFLSLIISGIFCSGYVVILLEFLNLFGLISSLSIAIGWFLFFLFLVVFGWRSDRLQLGWRRLTSYRPSLRWFEWLWVFFLGTIFVSLLAVALVSPPNNTDSLLYHMSRVMHWAQNESLAHYPTQYLHQLTMPPFAEQAILTLQILWGAERLSNLVQWVSLVGAAIGIYAIGGMFKFRRIARFAGVAFAVSVPMGLLQATSTQNDYVMTWWLVCLITLVLLRTIRPLSTIENLGLGFALGLGMLTKVTFFVYALPILAWYLFILIRNRSYRELLIGGFVIASIAVILNTGYWNRNLATFGGPFGPPDWVQQNLAIGSNFEQSIEAPETAEGLVGIPGFALNIAGNWISRFSQMVARNLVTPSYSINLRMGDVAENLPFWFGRNYPYEISIQMWNHEDTAGNPIHLIAVPISLIVILAFSRRKSVGELLKYALIVFAGYLLLPLLVSNANQLFSVRFQLAFFVLWSPVIAGALYLIDRRWLSLSVAFGFLLVALPVMLFNNTRPIIGRTPWMTKIDSIFTVPKEDIAFVAYLNLRDPIGDVAQNLLGSGCQRVELRIDSSDPEYLFWWAIKPLDNQIIVQSTYVDPSVEGLLDQEFNPCAVVCTTCSTIDEYNGMPLTGDFGYVRIFGASP